MVREFFFSYAGAYNRMMDLTEMGIKATFFQIGSGEFCVKWFRK